MSIILADLNEGLLQPLQIGPGETTSDGLFSLEIVACLGACSIAPVMTIDGEFFGRLDKKKLIEAIESFRGEEKDNA